MKHKRVSVQSWCTSITDIAAISVAVDDNNDEDINLVQ